MSKAIQFFAKNKKVLFLSVIATALIFGGVSEWESSRAQKKKAEGDSAGASGNNPAVPSKTGVLDEMSIQSSTSATQFPKSGAKAPLKMEAPPALEAHIAVQQPEAESSQIKGTGTVASAAAAAKPVSSLPYRPDDESTLMSRGVVRGLASKGEKGEASGPILVPVVSHVPESEVVGVVASGVPSGVSHDDGADAGGAQDAPAHRRSRAPQSVSEDDVDRLQSDRGAGSGLSRVQSGDLDFAPYGRFIKCQLVNTVESSSSETPIVGMVMEDLCWNNKVIIPAGAEVHDIAQTDTQRKRITSQDSWRIILPTMKGKMQGKPSGMELRIRAVALERESDPSNVRFGINDGSFGMSGEMITENNLDEVKIFAATFISAGAAGLQQTNTNQLTGTATPVSNVRNAGLSGVSAVLNEYARQVAEEVKAKGFYIRVMGGKNFYLYAQQVVSPQGADIPLPPEIPANEEFAVMAAKRRAKVQQAANAGKPSTEQLAREQLNQQRAAFDRAAQQEDQK